MASTVQPDKKLLVATVARPVTSSSGLMITPPPMPQMAPTMLAARLMIKKNNIIINPVSFPEAAAAAGQCAENTRFTFYYTPAQNISKISKYLTIA